MHTHTDTDTDTHTHSSSLNEHILAAAVYKYAQW